MSGAESATQAAVAEQRVTPLELFFDLVFVFAITQVTGFIAAHPTWTRLAEAMAILAALWWAWVAYAWLGNTAGSDGGALRVVLLAAMGPLFVISLAVPGAFEDWGLLFGLAYLAVRRASWRRARSSRSCRSPWPCPRSRRSAPWRSWPSR